MPNPVQLELKPLDISGKNYLTWASNARDYLGAEGLADTIMDENKASDQDKAKAVLILRHHLSEEFYCIERDPFVLWNDLKNMYEVTQKTIMLASARHEWEHLRVQDFESVALYSGAVYRIKAQLEVGGGVILSDEDMLEKTYSTLRTSNAHLKNICRDRICKTYSEFNIFLLLAEQIDGIVLKNLKSCPDGSSPFLKRNQNYERGHGRGHGRGYNRGWGRGRGNWNQNDPSKSFYSHLKCNKNNGKGKNNQRWA